MMLVRRFPMLVPRAPLCLLAFAVAACGPGTASPDSPAAAAATARAMVRPLLSRSPAATTPATGGQSTPEAADGLTSVVLVHRAEDGTLKVGCVGSEDGAEALVRASDEAR